MTNHDYEKQFDDTTPDKTQKTTVELTYQQIFMLYSIGCDFNEKEQSKKVDNINDILHKKLKAYNFATHKEKIKEQGPSPV